MMVVFHWKNLRNIVRKILNLIHNDLRRVIVEKYIGKVPNNYDNKCILINEIKVDRVGLEEYYIDLMKDGGK